MMEQAPARAAPKSVILMGSLLPNEGALRPCPVPLDLQVNGSGTGDSSFPLGSDLG